MQTLFNNHKNQQTASGSAHCRILRRADKPRSNPYWVESTCEFVAQFVNEQNDKKNWSKRNVNIRIDEDDNLTVYLNRKNLTGKVFYNKILKLETVMGEIDKVIIFGGGVYDYDGNPSVQTRELLNGLLERLGREEVIPKHCSIWMEPSGCYFGKYDQKILINRVHSTSSAIDADPDEFIFLPSGYEDVKVA